MKEFDQFKNKDEGENSDKKKNQFTIIKDDSTDGHGGYGVGSISLENMTPVIVDPNEEEAFVDMGALHARSKVEKRVRFKPDRFEVPNGKLYWIAWVTVAHREGLPCYYGVAGSELVVDREIRRGYKSMPEHVNQMDKSLKGRFVVEHMDEKSKRILGEYLRDFKPELWENTGQELKDSLGVQ
ncbi:YwhD family protein [Halobacillus amylolyticus]|uniref:YwhD family protein n=1 Tax=Halobacillus amylolyticus TaxID=2932259 RepID=A0ABY4H8L5_9BACI|nr:YwhD family protein [Halobacillus amylolyticus]UOR11213.1 YwhD family protein [Halobacillus amylolyticus]